jgi:exodeoxyribonuclease VIII
MQDIMLDLETMATTRDAAIVAIGAVEFDAASGLIGDRFYVPVDLVSSVSAGGRIDADDAETQARHAIALLRAVGRAGA